MTSSPQKPLFSQWEEIKKKYSGSDIGIVISDMKTNIKEFSEAMGCIRLTIDGPKIREMVASLSKNWDYVEALSQVLMEKSQQLACSPTKLHHGFRTELLSPSKTSAANIIELQDLLRSEKSRSASLQLQKAELNKRLEEMVVEQELLSAQLRAEIDKLKSCNRSLEVRAEQSEKHLRNMKREIEFLTKQSELLKQRLKQADKARSDEQGTKNSELNSLPEKYQEYEQSREDITKLQAEKAILIKGREQERKALEQTMRKLDDAERRLNGLNKIINSLELEIKELKEKSGNGLLVETAKPAKQTNDVEATLLRVHAAEIDRYQERLAQSLKARDATALQLRRSEDTLKKREQQLKIYKEDLIAKQNFIERGQAKIVQLEKQLQQSMNGEKTKQKLAHGGPRQVDLAKRIEELELRNKELAEDLKRTDFESHVLELRKRDEEIKDKSQDIKELQAMLKVKEQQNERNYEQYRNETRDNEETITFLRRRINELQEKLANYQ